jgi:hypothetical protein
MKRNSGKKSKNNSDNSTITTMILESGTCVNEFTNTVFGVMKNVEAWINSELICGLGPISSFCPSYARSWQECCSLLLPSD